MSVALNTTHPLPYGQQQLFARVGKKAKPKQWLSVSEYAERHIVLPSEVSKTAGRWRNDLNPALREPMDCLSIHSPVQVVALLLPTQFGKTQVGLNWMLSVVDQTPRMMLVVQADLPNRDKFVQTKLDPMIVANTHLHTKIRPARERDAKNSRSTKLFPGGGFLLGGAKTSSSLRLVTAPYIWADEIDEYGDFTDQGDILDVLIQRSKDGGSRRKLLLTSTPTLVGEGIDLAYSQTDMRQLHVPCPACGEYHVMDFFLDDEHKEIALVADAAGNVSYIARCCGAAIAEHRKPEMFANLRWIAQKPDVRLRRGYRLDSLASPIGRGFRWAELLEQWQATSGSTSKKKTFYQTALARAWKDETDELNHHSVMARVETYAAGIEFDLVTGFADVQADRIEITVVGWLGWRTETETPFALDHIIVAGDPTDKTVFVDARAEAINAGVQLLGIDSGNWATQVYEAVARDEWMVATKGVRNRAGIPLVEDRKKRLQRLRMRSRSGYAPELIGVDEGKALVFSRARRSLELAGALHFPNAEAFDVEYFEQLSSEKLTAITKGQRTEHRWIKQRPRNEALDCMVGNFAVKALAAMMPGKRPSAKAVRTNTTTPKPKRRTRRTRGRM